MEKEAIHLALKDYEEKKKEAENYLETLLELTLVYLIP